MTTPTGALFAPCANFLIIKLCSKLYFGRSQSLENDGKDCNEAMTSVRGNSIYMLNVQLNFRVPGIITRTYQHDPPQVQMDQGTMLEIRLLSGYSRHPPQKKTAL